MTRAVPGRLAAGADRDADRRRATDPNSAQVGPPRHVEKEDDGRERENESRALPVLESCPPVSDLLPHAGQRTPSHVGRGSGRIVAGEEWELAGGIPVVGVSDLGDESKRRGRLPKL